jgi:hypothetical protein
MTKTSIFISYRREPSADLARYLHQMLTEAGAEVFLDVDDIDSGRFEAVIRQQIVQADYVLVILASSTLESEWVRKEVQTALQANRNLIPLLLPDFQMEIHVPPELTDLRRIHGVPYTHYFADASLEKLKKAMKLEPQPVRLKLWLSQRGCSIQLTVGLVSVLLVGVFATLLMRNLRPTGTNAVPIGAASQATVVDTSSGSSSVTSIPATQAAPPMESDDDTSLPVMRCGEEIDARLNSPDALMDYALDAVMGDMVYIKVWPQNTTFLPTLNLIRPDESVIIHGELTNEFNSAQTPEFVLISPGPYIIRVGSQEGAGDFLLQVGCVLADGTVLNPSEE